MFLRRSIIKFTRADIRFILSVWMFVFWTNEEIIEIINPFKIAHCVDKGIDQIWLQLRLLCTLYKTRIKGATQSCLFYNLYKNGRVAFSFTLTLNWIYIIDYNASLKKKYDLLKSVSQKCFVTEFTDVDNAFVIQIIFSSNQTYV